MPSEYYNRNFRPQYFYHIFNRGAYKHEIFHDKEDYETFIEILTYYLKFPTAKYFSYKDTVKQPYSKVRNLHVDSVRLVTYCLMPNHFHFVLKQMPSADKKTNISNLMRRLMITYAMYFQHKHKHNGAIFQGRYKNVIVDSNEQLLHLSKYIHQHQTPYSSLPIYLKQAEPTDWLYPEYTLKLTKNYSKFLTSPTKEQAVKKLEPLTLE
ncbi:transposase [Patescibacteria group bacterium]|nr:transposase [Patescibacteria group bacterium]